MLRGVGEGMTDLTHVSTSDLVRELAGREWVEEHEIKQHMNIEQCFADDFSISWHKVTSGPGPATILVVRGEME